MFLREWFGGKIRLEPLADGGLMAHWNQNAAALLRGCERVVAGACFGATKTDVVCFSLERISEPMAIPGICGNRHLLTPVNLKVDQAKRRWRCRCCGRARAAEFRARHRPAG